MIFLETIAGLFNVAILILVIAIGLYTLLADVPKLRKRQFNREVKIARAISYGYIAGGMIIFFALRRLN